MKASLAVAALRNAVALRGPAGAVVHSARGSRCRARKFVRALHQHGLVGSTGRVGRAPTTPRWSSSSRCSSTTSPTASGRPPATSCDRPSSPGSNAPATADAGNADSANRPRSRSNYSTPSRSHSRPKPPNPRVNQSQGSPSCHQQRLSAGADFDEFVTPTTDHRLCRSQLGQVGATGDNAAAESFFSLLQNNVLNARQRRTRENSDSRQQPGWPAPSARHDMPVNRSPRACSTLSAAAPQKSWCPAAVTRGTCFCPLSYVVRRTFHSCLGCHEAARAASGVDPARAAL